MKMILSAIAAAAGLLCAAPAAHADDTDDLFLLSLESENIYLPDSTAIAVGRAACLDFASDATPEEVVSNAVDRTGLSFDEAGFLAGVAVAAYCPQFEHHMYG